MQESSLKCWENFQNPFSIDHVMDAIYNKMSRWNSAFNEYLALPKLTFHEQILFDASCQYLFHLTSKYRALVLHQLTSKVGEYRSREYVVYYLNMSSASVVEMTDSMKNTCVLSRCRLIIHGFWKKFLKTSMTQSSYIYWNIPANIA